MRRAGGVAVAHIKRTGVGGLLRKGKWLTVALGHAVSQVRRNGASPLAIGNILTRYFGMTSVGAAGWTWSFDSMKPHLSGLATFAADDWGKRRTGHYRRVSRGNMLPVGSEGIVAFLAAQCGSAPGVDFQATGLLPANIDWGRAVECYQDYISGYDPGLIGSDGLPGSYDMGRRWKDQAAITYAADGLSWLASKVGVNRYLPKKINF